MQSIFGIGEWMAGLELRGIWGRLTTKLCSVGAVLLLQDVIRLHA